MKARRVTTGRNGDRWTQLFFRFLAATPTHRYAWTSNPFPARQAAESQLSQPAAKKILDGLFFARRKLPG